MTTPLKDNPLTGHKPGRKAGDDAQAQSWRDQSWEELRATRYWERKTLAEMDDHEWEALCDGCGRCCLVLLTDEDTGETFETDVACRLFDASARRCRDYEARHARVPDCLRLTPESAGALPWMPQSCAYRRLARGEGLADWHPLVSGDPNGAAAAGIAVPAHLDSEDAVSDSVLETRITDQRC